MKKLPAFQFYPADWLKDLGIRSLNYFERGVWFEMLCLMHQSEERGRLVLNGRPMSDEQIADMLNLPHDVFKQTLSKLLANGVAKRDSLASACYNKRMVDDERERQELHEKRAAAGRNGGRQKARNTTKSLPINDLDGLANAKQTASKTPSKTVAKASTSIPIPINTHTLYAREDFAFPVDQIVKAFPHMSDHLTPAQIGLLEVEITDAAALAKTIEKYQGNYDSFHNRYLPEKVSTFIEVYRAELKKSNEAKNGQNKQTFSGNRRTNADKLADYGEIFERYADAGEADGREASGDRFSNQPS